jgi:hypothetical protein
MAPRVIGFLCVTFCLGCADGKPLPALYPVKGTILKNGQPVQGGSIRFHPESSQEDLIIISAVGDNREFALATKSSKRHASGAPPGKYRVVYTPRISKTSFQPTTLKEPVTIEVKENDLTIELGR